LRRYEILFIAHADLSDDNLNEIIERYKTTITTLQGIIVKIDKWGTRKLAYEIKKQSKGSYVLIDFAGKSSIVLELERNLKIDDKILKFMTVLKDDEVDPLELQKELHPETTVEAETIEPKTDSPEISTESITTQPIDEKSTEESKGEEV
jgi:small subunit ribosomal protein S6